VVIGGALVVPGGLLRTLQPDAAPDASDSPGAGSNGAPEPAAPYRRR